MSQQHKNSDSAGACQFQGIIPSLDPTNQWDSSLVSAFHPCTSSRAPASLVLKSRRREHVAECKTSQFPRVGETG